ncbi:MAG: MBL fold metallo-hydrolase [Hyphomicrobiaceae bacterium]
MRFSGPPTRRHFLTGSGASALGLAMGAPARPSIAATRTHTMRLGQTEITTFSDGIFVLPLSFALPDTAKEEAEAFLKSHGDRLAFVGETNIVVVRSGSTLALIDTGGGTDFMPSLGKLPDALESADVRADEVTHVIFTHAHADHFWGVMDPFTEASRWPNARHIMTAIERDFWLADGVEHKVPDAAKGMAIGINRRLKALGDVISTVRDGTEIAPGIAFLGTPGHTPGHASVVVRDGSNEIVIGGDALTHAAVSFAHSGWRWGADLDWQQAAETRARLLDRLASSKALFAGYHLPWPGIGHTERHGTAYRFVPDA